MRIAIVFLLTVACVLGAIGCKKDEEKDEGRRGTPDTTRSAGNAVALADPLNLWQAGKHDDAQRLLVAAAWATNCDSGSKTVLELTEADYARLSGDERAKRDTELNVYMTAARELVRSSMNAAKAKSAADAEKDYSAILEYGRCLARDDGGLSMRKALGKGIKRSALNELITIYSTTGQQGKLEAAKKELSQL